MRGVFGMALYSKFENGFSKGVLSEIGSNNIINLTASPFDK